MKNSPLFTATLVLFWVVLAVSPVRALQIIAPAPPVASPAEGIGVGGSVGYVFITPRHFLTGHAGPPLSVNSIAVSNFGLISTSQSALVDEEMYVVELASDLPGVNPLPIAFSPILSDYVNLTLRVFGNQGYTYGYNNSGATAIFTMNNDAGLGGPPPPATVTLPIAGAMERAPTVFDAFMFVDVRGNSTTPGHAFLQFGDSNGAMVVELPGGVLAAMGTALGFNDFENPLRSVTSLWPDIDYHVFNLAGFYQTQIEDYLTARSLALGETYTAQFIPLNTVIPEPTRALMLSLGLALILFRRRR